MLTFVVVSLKKHYTKLVSRTKKHSIDEILDFFVAKTDQHNKDIDTIKKEITSIVYDSKFHFRKVGIVHFNPFGKTGDEQSFVMSLLDGYNNGIVINFIYTHEGMRIYTKVVKNGKSTQYALSQEEIRAIEKAQ